jgi:hypothetical protein
MVPFRRAAARSPPDQRIIAPPAGDLTADGVHRKGEAKSG